MMKRKFNRTARKGLFVSSLLLLSGLSCTDFWDPRSVVVDLPQHEPLLVINSFIHPDSVFEVTVAQSTPFLEQNRDPFIEDASVVITTESGDMIAELNHVEFGLYRASVKPEIGVTYRLDVSVEGFTPVHATATIPTPIRIDSVLRKVNLLDQFTVDITVYFQDPAAQKNHYTLLFLTRRFDGREFVYDVTGFVSSDAVLKKPDDFEDESYYYDDAFFDDALFDGEFYDLDFEYYNFSIFEEAEVAVALLTTTESYYNYRKTLEQQNNTEDNPFAEPVPIYSNIENGIGIFCAYSSNFYPVIPGNN